MTEPQAEGAEDVSPRIEEVEGLIGFDEALGGSDGIQVARNDLSMDPKSDGK